MTDDILSIIEKRQKKGQSTQSTALYQAASTLKDFHLSPSQWRRLSRFDKKVLMYSRIMEQHYQDSFYEEAERKREVDQRQREMMNEMPKQVLPRRGR